MVFDSHVQAQMMRENRAVGMACYQDFIMGAGIGTKLFFNFVNKFHVASGSGRGFETNQLQGTPYIPYQESSQRP